MDNRVLYTSYRNIIAKNDVKLILIRQP